MKKSFLNLLKRAFLLMGVVSLVTLYSCDKDSEETVKDPIASFQFAVSTSNYLEVTFTNYSQNATSYSWNFGDQQTSTDTDPVHVYDAAGDYDVVLTATNSANVSKTYTQTITITDPNEALAILAGTTSKTWKLFREGKSMWMDPHWADGLTNNGARPCLYKQEFTFSVDGTYSFDDKGAFWAEYGVFNNTGVCDVNTTPESCMDVTSGELFNECNDDVSAWLSGDHAYEYNATIGELTLSGEGAWIGIPKLGTDGESIVPVSSVTCNIALTQETGYDLMTLTWNYGDITWTVVYASYSDASLEPELVEEQAPFGEDLADITPTEMKVTFASKDALDMVLLDTVESGSGIAFGVADPTDAAAKVGEFTRVAGNAYQELKFQTFPDKMDIQFDNFTKATIEVYFPSTNDYTASLTKSFVWGFADVSQTKDWWTDIVQLENTDIPLDTWTKYEFDLTGAKARTDLDMFYIGMGGGGHEVGGTFYVRNLIFE